MASDAGEGTCLLFTRAIVRRPCCHPPCRSPISFSLSPPRYNRSRRVCCGASHTWGTQPWWAGELTTGCTAALTQVCTCGYGAASIFKASARVYDYIFVLIHVFLLFLFLHLPLPWQHPCVQTSGASVDSDTYRQARSISCPAAGAVRSVDPCERWHTRCCYSTRLL